MPPTLYRLLLAGFGRLPRGLRRRLVRWGSPCYTVGAVCVIQRPDGQILLVQQRYRHRWGLPGGLLARRETPIEAVRREVMEEVGLELDLVGPPTVVVEPRAQRVDIVYQGRPAGGPGAEEAQARSPEIVEARWFSVDALPELQDESVEILRAVLGEIDHAAGRTDGPPPHSG